jgi:hypothetical protein
MNDVNYRLNPSTRMTALSSERVQQWPSTRSLALLEPTLKLVTLLAVNGEASRACCGALGMQPPSIFRSCFAGAASPEASTGWHRPSVGVVG